MSDCTDSECGGFLDEQLYDAKCESIKAIKSFLDDAWGESPLDENGILEVIELIASGKVPHLKFE